MYLYLIYMYALFISYASAFNNINYVPKYKMRQILFNIYNIKEKGDNTLEHIIPQSTFKDNKNISKDLHNIMLYPSKVNSHRSNYKYISNPNFYEDSKLLCGEGNIIKYENSVGNKYFIKSSKNKLFYPKEQYRGEISRAAMYFCYTYPNYKNEIFSKVIDPYTILTWHHEYPISNFEKYKSIEIEKIQGNKNLFVEDPKQAVIYMEEILNKKFPIYHNYNYDK